jgi:hemerythrin-like domain-containing protein
MTPTDVLRAEHRLILRALDVLETAAPRTDVTDEWWADAVRWLQGFADRNHHNKEEAELFPAMVKAGVPNEGGPIGVMLAEHEEGRALVRAIDTGRGDARASAVRRYVALLRQHIDKEDNVLFEIADAVLDAPARAQLARAFDDVAAGMGVEASPEHAAARLDALASALAADRSGAGATARPADRSRT